MCQTVNRWSQRVARKAARQGSFVGREHDRQRRAEYDCYRGRVDLQASVGLHAIEPPDLVRNKK